MGNTLTRFLGGSPGRIAIQLIAMSFIVGIILSVLGVSPYDIVAGIERLVRRSPGGRIDRAAADATRTRWPPVGGAVIACAHCSCTARASGATMRDGSSGE